jgi:hypothetical protein
VTGGGQDQPFGTEAEFARKLTFIGEPMSLDFVLIKSHGHPLSMDEIDMDVTFTQEDYKALAERFFDGIVWRAAEGIVSSDDMSFELRPSDISLSITARGPGDTVAYMDRIAALGAQHGIVVIDVQGSEILVPIAD